MISETYSNEIDQLTAEIMLLEIQEENFLKLGNFSEAEIRRGKIKIIMERRNGLNERYDPANKITLPWNYKI